MLELAQTKADGTYRKTLQQLARLDILILDDWGLEPLKAAQRNDLMEIMDDAILDRLMHNAHRIKLKGESMRKTRSVLTDGEHLA